MKSSRNQISSALLSFGLTLFFFFLDRLSKLWAEVSLFDRDIPLLGKIARFHLTHNTALAFSLPFPRAATIFLSLLLLTALLFHFSKLVRRGWIEVLSAALIFGGALGNLADRIVFGSVTDFIAVWKFPVFNLADTFLFLGVCLLLFAEYRNRHG